MVKHIVMWKLKEELNGKSKNELASEMKVRLLDLKGKIHELKNIEVGINGINFDKNSDIVLITDFNTYNDLSVYANHPDHLKVGDFVKEVAISRACVDYEY